MATFRPHRNMVRDVSVSREDLLAEQPGVA